MHRLAMAGAVILPAMPGWYHGVESLQSMVDFVVSRILDQIDVDNALMKRWGE
jgi:4-hydroxy-3-polyprenylbenzoate decarboxylase